MTDNTNNIPVNLQQSTPLEPFNARPMYQPPPFPPPINISNTPIIRTGHTSMMTTSMEPLWHTPPENSLV